MKRRFIVVLAAIGLALSCSNAAAQVLTQSVTLTYESPAFGNLQPVPNPYPGITAATVTHAAVDQLGANFMDVFFYAGGGPGSGYGDLTNVAFGPYLQPSSVGLVDPAWGVIKITPNYPGAFVRLKSFDIASDDNNIGGDETIDGIYIHGEDPYTETYWYATGVTVAGDVNNASHTQINFGGTPVNGLVDGPVAIWWEVQQGNVAVDNVKFDIVGPPTGTDFYRVAQGGSLAVAAPGVLANDLLREQTGSLTASPIVGPTKGTLNLNSDGGFSYTSTGSTGMDFFTYQASNALNNSAQGTALISVLPPGALFYDDFARPAGFVGLTPWKVVDGTWVITNGMLCGITNGISGHGHADHYVDNNWTDYSVEVRASVGPNGYGWALGGRLNPATGEYYEVFLYANYDGVGPWRLHLTKHTRWGPSGWDGINLAYQPDVEVPGVGTTTLHSLKMTFQGNRILVHFDGVLKMDVRDNNFPSHGQPWPVLTSGGIIVGMYSTNNSELKVEDVIVRQLPVATNLLVTTLEETSTNLVLQGSIGEGTKSLAILNGPTHGLLTGFNPSSGTLTYTPATNYNGADAFTFTVGDGTLLATGTVNVTVAPVNDSPEVAIPITDQFGTFGSPFSFTFPANTFTDVDGQTLAYAATGMPPGVAFGGSTRAFSGTPLSAGSFPVQVVANDGGVPNLKATNNFVITIAKSNAPVSLGNLVQTYDGTARAATATTQPPGLTVNLSYEGGTSPPTNAGSYQVIASIAEANYTGAATNTLTIAPRPLAVTGVSAATKVYDGTTSATLDVSGAALAGVVAGDEVSLTTPVYDNSIQDLFIRFPAGNSEIGDEVILAATADRVRKFSFEYWGDGPGPGNHDPFEGNVFVTLRFYKNDGPLISGLEFDAPSPATLLFKSKPFPITATERSVLTYTDAGDFQNPEWADVLLTQPLTNSFTWTVQFSGLGPNDSVGLDLYSPPVIGSNYPDYWKYDGAAWALLTYYGAPPINFGARLECHATGTFNNKQVGNGKTVTITGFSLGGADAPNYTLTPPTTAANITPKLLTLPALEAPDKVYDGTTSANILSYGSLSGILAPDSVTLITNGATAIFSTAQAGSNKTVTVSGLALSGADATNYSIGTPTTTADITPKALSITANNAGKTYGQTVTFAGTEFTTGVGELVNGDNVTSVTLTSGGAAAVAATAGSPYPITPSAAVGTGLGNYQITYQNGALTVNTKALTVTANNAEKTYGQAVTFAGTEFTTGVGELVNGDNVTSVTLSSTGAAATATTAGSPYPITPSAAVGTGLGNYQITYLNGALALNPKALTITANDASKTYGQTMTFAGTEFTTGVGELVNSDNVASVTLTSAGTPATAPANAGAASAALGGSAYPIVPSAAVGTGLGNYQIVYQDGTLTINTATLLVAADDKSRPYGYTNPVLSGTIVGIQNGDPITASFATSADVNSPPGDYSIVTTLLDPDSKLGNYTATVSNGTLTVVSDDLDADGLPDDFELAHGLSPTNSSDAALDLDGDRLTAVQEYRAGTDLSNSASALRISAVAQEGNDMRVSFHSVAGRSYLLQRNDQYPSSAGWTDVTPNIPGNGSIASAVDVGANNVPASSRRVYRISLTNVVSEPAGFSKLSLLGNSDTLLSFAFPRTEVAAGLVQSVSGNQIQIHGPPDWTANQLVYQAGSQPNTYYLLIRSGALEGRSYTITNNGADTVTVDSRGEDLSTLGLLVGDGVSIIPYWTLGTAFAGGNGVYANTNPIPVNNPTEVLLPDLNGSGKNLSASKTFYYWQGAWRAFGEGNANKDDFVLVPNACVIVRHNQPDSTVCTVPGAVVTSKISIPLRVLAAGQQDNFVALPRPMPLSLNDSGLISSGAFTASPSPLSHTDELLVFDTTLAAKNKSATATYYYWNGTWLEQNTGASPQGAVQVFTPGTAVTIRKGASAAAPPVWINSPPAN